MNCTRCNIYIKKADQLIDEAALHFKKKKYNLCRECKSEFEYGFTYFIKNISVVKASQEEEFKKILDEIKFPISERDMCKLLKWCGKYSDEIIPLCSEQTNHYSQINSFHHKCVKCYTKYNWRTKD